MRLTPTGIETRHGDAAELGAWGPCRDVPAPPWGYGGHLGPCARSEARPSGAGAGRAWGLGGHLGALRAFRGASQLRWGAPSAGGGWGAISGPLRVSRGAPRLRRGVPRRHGGSGAVLGPHVNTSPAG